VRSTEEILGDHLGHAANRLRLVLRLLHKRLIVYSLNQTVTEQRQRGSAGYAVAATGEVRAGRIAGRQLGAEGRARGFLLLTRRKLASRHRDLASERLGLHAVGKNSGATLRLRAVTEHVIDREDMHRSGISVAAHSYFVDKQSATARGR